MPIASTPLEIYYETEGDPSDEPLLLIMGLGAQLVAWDLDFCKALVDRGFFVIRFDNRDVGLSAKCDGQEYRLTDMARDAVGVLDAVGVESAHVVGASMGGMIAQTVAIEHPGRVKTLTSIMSTTGEPEVGAPDPAAITQLMTARPTDREAAIAAGIETQRLIGGPHFDEERARAKGYEAFDRCFFPEGFVRQITAIMGSGSRAEGLAALDVPALVIHGEIDPLVTLSGGRRTAELIPGAELLVLEDMGHDLPPLLWAPVVDAITSLAARAAA